MSTRTTRTVFVSLAAVALTATSLAAPANASERQAIDRAIGHTLTPALIAPALGKYKVAYSGTAFRGYESTWGVCSLENPARSAGFKGMHTEVRMSFTPKRKGVPQGVGQSIFLFASSADASKTFQKLQRDVKRCSGSFTEREESGGSLGELIFQSKVSNGTMQAVPGITTLTVENDWSSEWSGASAFRQDEFATYSLVNDAIVLVRYQRSPGGSASAAEKRGAQATTKAAIERYQSRFAPKSGSIQATFAAGAARSLDRRDIPASLGKQSAIKPGELYVTSGRDRIWLCDLEGKRYTDDGDTAPFIGITSDPVTVSNYFMTGKNGRYVQEVILDFRSSQRAASAFKDLRAQAKRCNGIARQQISGSDDETGEPFDGVITRNYKVSEKSIAGTSPSIVLDWQFTVQVPSTEPARPSGTYETWTLQGSRVVWLYFGREGVVTAQEKAGAEQLTKTAVDRLR